jgi:hypothetical protein
MTYFSTVGSRQTGNAERPPILAGMVIPQFAQPVVSDTHESTPHATDTFLDKMVAQLQANQFGTLCPEFAPTRHDDAKVQEGASTSLFNSYGYEEHLQAAIARLATKKVRDDLLGEFASPPPALATGSVHVLEDAIREVDWRTDAGPRVFNRDAKVARSAQSLINEKFADIEYVGCCMYQLTEQMRVPAAVFRDNPSNPSGGKRIVVVVFECNFPHMEHDLYRDAARFTERLVWAEATPWRSGPPHDKFRCMLRPRADTPPDEVRAALGDAVSRAEQEPWPNQKYVVCRSSPMALLRVSNAASPAEKKLLAATHVKVSEWTTLPFSSKATSLGDEDVAQGKGWKATVLFESASNVVEEVSKRTLLDTLGRAIESSYSAIGVVCTYLLGIPHVLLPPEMVDTALTNVEQLLQVEQQEQGCSGNAAPCSGGGPVGFVTTIAPYLETFIWQDMFCAATRGRGDRFYYRDDSLAKGDVSSSTSGGCFDVTSCVIVLAQAVASSLSGGATLRELVSTTALANAEQRWLAKSASDQRHMVLNFFSREFPELPPILLLETEPEAPNKQCAVSTASIMLPLKPHEPLTSMRRVVMKFGALTPEELSANDVLAKAPTELIGTILLHPSVIVIRHIRHRQLEDAGMEKSYAGCFESYFFSTSATCCAELKTYSQLLFTPRLAGPLVDGPCVVPSTVPATAPATGTPPPLPTVNADAFATLVAQMGRIEQAMVRLASGTAAAAPACSMRAKTAEPHSRQLPAPPPQSAACQELESLFEFLASHYDPTQTNNPDGTDVSDKELEIYSGMVERMRALRAHSTRKACASDHGGTHNQKRRKIADAPLLPPW